MNRASKLDQEDYYPLLQVGTRVTGTALALAAFIPTRCAFWTWSARWNAGQSWLGRVCFAHPLLHRLTSFRGIAGATEQQ